MPDSQEIEEKLQEKLQEQEETESTQPTEEGISSPERSKAKSPWQTGVRQSPQERESLSKRIEDEEEEEGDQSPMLRRSTRRSKPNPKYANAALVEDVKEPSTYEEASERKEWRQAMEEEIRALKQNERWDLVPRTKDIKAISCKWLSKVKTRPDESVERYKARQLARRFSQQYGLDYDETFSPVAKITTVRVLLALAASKSWKLRAD